MKKLTTEEFIEKAYVKHGNKYDYSRTEYVNNSTKVCIICPKHGEFWQSPTNHLNGQGCPKCKFEKVGKSNSLSKEEFISRANEIHGKKYDYSKVEYHNMKSKVVIVCPIHGEFEQICEDHIYNKSGCPLCNGKKQYTTKTFIDDARKVHGDKYDYSKTKYINAKTKVCIICPKHGEFWQRPEKHLVGQGCVACSYEERGERKKILFEEFLDKANKIHENSFIYNEKSYKGFNEKVEITCCKCGKKFKQKASNHIHLKQGCPFCNLSKIENDVSLFLKENAIEFVQQKKFEWLGRQSLDFYLPQYGVAIECQGIQHYKPIDFFGGEKNFEYTIEKDTIKKKLCLEHGLKILYYTNQLEYSNKDLHFSDLNEMLTKILEKN